METDLRRARLEGLHGPAYKLELAFGELGSLGGSAKGRRLDSIGHGSWW